MTQHVVVLLIMDMESAKSDVNGPKKKYVFGAFYLKKKSDQKNNFKNISTQTGLNLNWVSKKFKMVLATLSPISI